jgi:hypothetical protein
MSSSETPEAGSGFQSPCSHQPPRGEGGTTEIGPGAPKGVRTKRRRGQRRRDGANQPGADGEAGEHQDGGPRG